MMFEGWGTPVDLRQPGWRSCHALTAFDARQLLAKDIPGVSRWMCWMMDPDPAEATLRAMTGKKFASSGQCGPWTWERVPTSYPDVCFWDGDPEHLRVGMGWVGALRIRGSGGEEFILFSYMRPDSLIGKEYLVSTDDLALLRRFTEDVHAHLKGEWKGGPKMVHIDVVNGPDVVLNAEEDEPIYLEASMRADIEEQVDAFYAGGDIYRRLNIPYRRGFLFAGPPGTGKTLMVRRLVRHCFLKHNACCRSLTINMQTGLVELMHLFSTPRSGHPVMIILEEIDCLVRETRITRAALLAQLDGLEPPSGTLVLATTNNPQEIDPALLDRPSRFDRVWSFPLPGKPIRARYIEDRFGGVSEEVLAKVTSATSGWSVAYIKELRVTAAVKALQQGRQEINDTDVLQALDLLRQQFLRAKRRHQDKTPDETGHVGFNADGDTEAA